MNYQDYKYYFFIGIGGIGMSSLANYLKIKNKKIAGYDREKTKLVSIDFSLQRYKNVKNFTSWCHKWFSMGTDCQ